MKNIYFIIYCIIKIKLNLIIKKNYQQALLDECKNNIEST